MKGKFFYKIDYNTDNWKKQYRNSKVGKIYHNLEKSGSKPGKIRCFWYYSPHFCFNFVRKQGFRIFRRKQEYDEEQQKQIEKRANRKNAFQDFRTEPAGHCSFKRLQRDFAAGFCIHIEYRSSDIFREEGRNMAGMILLAADQLDRYVGKEWAMILDIRSRREYEKGHIKGAVNLPYDHLLERVCLPRDKIIVIYCERGAASMAEGKLLAENGYEVRSVIGGMHAYRGQHLVQENEA